MTLYHLSIIYRSISDENYFDDFKNKNGIDNIIDYAEQLCTSSDVNLESKSIQMILEMLCDIFNLIFNCYNNDSNEDIMFHGMRILSIYIPEIIILLGKLNSVKYVIIYIYILF